MAAEPKTTSAPTIPKSAPAAFPPTPGNTPPLFRRIDWLAFAITTLVVFMGYFLTLAPEVTLEDSGELAVGSFYAGIPHPPGYPVWTICTWLFSTLVPIGSIAYRVAMASALSGALAAGLLAFLVSRGSSMMIEGINGLEKMDRRWENAICIVSGFVSGILIGFDGYMWSQAVIVEVYPFAVLSLMGVLVCLLRWIYAPHQHRFLYYALFLFGICFTNHQSLLVAAVGIEIAIATASPKLGRDMFCGNAIIYMTYNLLTIVTGHQMFHNLETNALLFKLFHGIGIVSIIGCVWLMIRTKKFLTEGWVVTIMAALWVFGAAFYLYMAVAGMSNPPMQWGYPRTVEGFFHALTRGQYEQPSPTDVFNSPGRVVSYGGLLLAGIAEEFNWVLTLVALIPFAFFFKMQRRERAWMIGLAAIYFCLGPLLAVLFNISPDRSSMSLLKVFFTAGHVLIALFVGYGLTLTAACLAVRYESFRPVAFVGGIAAIDFALFTLVAASQALLGNTELSNATTSYDLWKVLLWAIAATGLALSARDRFAEQKQLLRYAAILSIAISFGLTIVAMLGNQMKLDGLSIFAHAVAASFHPDQYALPVFAGMMLLAITVIFTFTVWRARTRAALGLILFLFALAPLHSPMCHWFDNEQRNHYFGYWFGHDMFTPPFKGADNKPLYPEMTRDAFLYGGTDPGRFCPTYMVFAESFTPHDKQPALDQKFDRRDIYIVTQNALADGTYLCYIRAHYNRSKQIDPPFFQELVRGAKEKELNYRTNFVSKALKPLDTFFTHLGDQIERSRRAGSSLFTENDFTDLASFTAKLKSAADPLSKYLAENITPKTKSLLSGNNAELRKSLATDLNILLERELLENDTDSTTKHGPLYTPERFTGVTLPETTRAFIAQNPQSHTRIRLNRILLEAAYPQAFTTSLGGVYPDREIYIATPTDSQNCFNEYMSDVQKRMQHDTQLPNEPRQIRPGENVQVIDGRIQVNGQVAVMSINGLISKVMFDQNPNHEFFVEESFPLDWMYPHLTPFGVILKVNRKPIPEITEDMIRRDHEFWSQYSQRLIGNWITYDTSVKEICEFVHKAYLRHDFSGFKGDRKFIRDDQAQKAFSKLRSSIAASVYGWRINNCKSPAEQQRMIREADFAYRQAFAFCPYSPEALFHYVQLLINVQRNDDALLIAQTAAALDPFNGQIADLVKNLGGVRSNPVPAPVPAKPAAALAHMQQEYAANPANFQNAFDLAATLASMNDTNRATEILIQTLNHPKTDANVAKVVAQAFAQMNSYPGLELALDRLSQLAPELPESWYDLAALKTILGKNDKALAALTTAIQLADKHALKDPKTRNLRVEALKDPRFGILRTNAQFQKIIASQ